ncbi:cartilage intermediate layer protein 1 [Nematolebias whitei]|uniref:cartilage intermediate layer protein 1 n=1 Tax=Nematolebias whitei TaxID=451745 RepID=UPI00189AD6CB|nr:cartilage intermediate layer protein 1 [Nematolebias whitei]
MINQISFGIAVVLLGYVGASTYEGVPGCWTNWYNRDTPKGAGDFETLSELRKMYPAEICIHPLRIEAVTTTGIPAEKTGQKLSVYSVKEGLICLNQNQKSGTCLDYKIRFECICHLHCLDAC